MAQRALVALDDWQPMCLTLQGLILVDLLYVGTTHYQPVLSCETLVQLKLVTRC
jgi:hypothetical protein